MSTRQDPDRLSAALRNLMDCITPGDGAGALYAGLVNRFASPAGVIEAPRTSLEEEGLSAQNALLLSLLPDIARYIGREPFGLHPVLATCRRAAEFLSTRFIGIKFEHLYVLCLDANGRLLSDVLLQRGTTDSAPIYIRHILAEVARTRARAIVVSHNHPGNSLRPSNADVSSTLNLMSALYPLGVPLLDHIIIADGMPISLRSSGAIQDKVWIAQAPENKLIRHWLDGYTGL